MVSSQTGIRRGLPRVVGGDPWPPAGDVPAVHSRQSEGVGGVDPQIAASELVAADAEAVHSRQNAGVAGVESQIGASEAGAGDGAGATLRRGLPRVTGGEPWPPASAAPVHSRQNAGVAGVEPQIAASEAVAADAEAVHSRQNAGVGGSDPQFAASEAAAVAAGAGAAAGAAGAGAAAGVVLRRGLPRVVGGEGWPPAGTIANPAPAAPAASHPAASPVHSRQSAGVEGVEAQIGASEPAPPAAQTPATQAAAASTAVAAGPREALRVPQTVWAGRAPAHLPAVPEPVRIGPFTKAQWAGVTLVGGVVLLILAGMAVAAVRYLLSLEPMQQFLTAYPGEYHLPETAPVGIPAWIGWQHFFNVFLMVLIIRSGLTIRTEKRPTAFWAPRNNPKGKTSLTIWFHQALDILWLVNGVVFVVLLVVTGQWMRIVPTSWEVFPNALSAALQYVSLDWPTENGWVNYNSLQQLAYFSTVFLAAPLAAITGWRMSGMWPKNNQTLNRLYPVEWARKVHFPVMLYFVAFIFVHVALVLSTGALRNLNHMYSAQGSVDGVAYANNWTGFWMFFASLVVIAGAVAAARPLVLAPIARLFGTVSGR